MAPTITRLVLSLALIVAAPVFYIVMLFAWMSLQGGYDSEIALLVTTVVIGLGFAVGWLLIWMFEVKWTTTRVVLTGVAFGSSLVLTMASGAVLASAMGEEEFGIILGGMLFAVFYMVGTGLAWMETPTERRRRLADVGAGDVLCPVCGYNLRGLKATACPECGASFTLDSLLAAQLERNRQLGEPKQA